MSRMAVTAKEGCLSLSEMVVPGGGPEERYALCIQKGQQRASVAGRKIEGRGHNRTTDPGRLCRASEQFTFSSEGGGKPWKCFQQMISMV